MRFFFAPLLLLASCLAVLDAKTGPGTDFPCGVDGVSCGGGMCCTLQGDICGGTFLSCPVGMCCHEGESMKLARPQTKSK